MPEIDYSKRSFNYYPTNAIVFAKCIDGRWTKPEVTADFNFTVHAFAGVFHYAPSCFEGLKAYRGADGTIQLFEFLNDMEKVAGALAEKKILVTGLSVTGDTLEDYFLNKIGGNNDD